MRDPKDGLKVCQIKRTKGALRERVLTRTKKMLEDKYSSSDSKDLETMRDYVKNRPYGFETVFAYTTLIDTERKIRNAIFDRPVPGTGIDDAEVHALQYLLEGNFYASLGRYTVMLLFKETSLISTSAAQTILQKPRESTKY